MRLLFKACFMMAVFLVFLSPRASGAGFLEINGGAAATTGKSVVLTLTAENPDIVSRMCISNSLYCKSWGRYSTTKRWKLTKGDGTKTVYVWFKDTAGNVSTVYSASIIRDEVNPEDGTVTAEPGDGQITLHWNGFTDSTSGIAGYRVVYSENEAPASCSRGEEVPGYDGTSRDYVHSGLTNSTVYGYRICAIDSAGNMSSGAAITGAAAGGTQIPAAWIWGVTTDDPNTGTVQQIDALKSLPGRVMVRTVFDLPLKGYPTADDYLSSITEISSAADVMGLPLDSSYMAQTDLASVTTRINEYLNVLGSSVKVWEIGNEVNGDWLGSDVIAKVEAMYDAVKTAGKPAALTLYYFDDPPGADYDMIQWVDTNIPAGHRMRTGLDYVFVSYYEDDNNGHHLTQSEVDGIFSSLSERFPNAIVGFGEFGWGSNVPNDDQARASLINRFYNYRAPSVANFAGGGFYWHFRQTMVPKTEPDWNVFKSLMESANVIAWWRPVPQTSWDIQFSGALNTSYDVSMYDLDLFDTDTSVIDSLHAQGRKVVCYISAGSYEDWRPDADRFPVSVLGKNYPGWPGEKFIDIRSTAVRQIMSDRLDLCRSKGFDGVDPDNIDVFGADSGFPLTYQDGINYANWLAQQAHARGLGIGQKNSPEITDAVQPNFDWAVTEDCYGQDPASPWCAQMQPYIYNNKAVFMIEYTDSISNADFLTNACQWGGASNRFSPILKKRNLDGFMMRCN